jgi:hypothetical protein
MTPLTLYCFLRKRAPVALTHGKSAAAGLKACPTNCRNHGYFHHLGPAAGPCVLPCKWPRAGQTACPTSNMRRGAGGFACVTFILGGEPRIVGEASEPVDPEVGSARRPQSRYTCRHALSQLARGHIEATALSSSARSAQSSRLRSPAAFSSCATLEKPHTAPAMAACDRT